MIRFCQPCDYRHKGRNIWFNPNDVITIKPSDDNYGHCIITLRNGDAFTIDMTAEDAAKKINEAKEAL